MPDLRFHPAVAAWFRETLGAPTDAQTRAWQAIRDGKHCLIAAPTGSGKTLAAFLNAIDQLVCEGLDRPLPEETRVLYISPLKALSNDIDRNLQLPLSGIRDRLLEAGLADVEISTAVRTGDTSQSDRARMRQHPPHILVTTPESLYILLTSESGRRMLTTVRDVIVDEIHAVAGSKRGAHLALSLERLVALCDKPPRRIGLSATQKPIEDMACLLTGSNASDCNIVDTGHSRDRDLALELTGSPLQAVMPGEVWTEVYDRLAALATAHKTTLIFVNTRRLAERAARHLAERLGEVHVTCHHGSLSRQHRFNAEQRLKQGSLKVLVATASLELGIDIGDIDLVCQLGSPRGIAAFLQRVGRSGHAIGGLPKGRLFPLSRDDLVESVALLDGVRRGELDRIRMPVAPLDVLAQQLVAEISGRDWPEDDLFRQFRQAWPYRDLDRHHWQSVLSMLADGYTTRRGRRGAYLHWDRVNGMLRARRNARLTAISNGGAIPDQFDSEMILVPEGSIVGSLNEDFAFESLPGDIVQLGNTSYRMLKIEMGRVYVEDAQGQPPNIPFWFGEAPGRSDELSQAVSRLREEFQQVFESRGAEAAEQWLIQTHGLDLSAAQQLTEYLGTATLALNGLPTQRRIVMERFFDESGDTHLVIHSPYGSRLNRGWGLALRKRFCRQFNFELQASALEDSIVLSLGPTHSFPLEEVRHYLNADSVRDVLIQALLAAPMFPTRWRWNASIALAVPRMRNGKRRPPQFQRQDAEDLMAVVFPDQLACAENLAGPREAPDHPLVNQTIEDCLTDTMDIDGLETLLRRIADNEVEVVCCDLRAPSPLTHEILNARPYAFLDDGAAEERRTLSVRTDGALDLSTAADLGRLSAEAIASVRDEAWPEVRDREELHDALHVLGFMTGTEMTTCITALPAMADWLDELQAARRIFHIDAPESAGFWVTAERLPEFATVHPQWADSPQHADAGQCLIDLLRSRMEGLGPVTAARLAKDFQLPESRLAIALAALQQQGFVMQGDFSDCGETEWCERRLLHRIHRYTLYRRRREIEPVDEQTFMRFLFDWQGIARRRHGVGAATEQQLLDALYQLEGWDAAATAWEADLLPARVPGYTPDLLDRLSAAGEVSWMRRIPPTIHSEERRSAPVKSTPIALLPRADQAHWLTEQTDRPLPPLSADAQRVLEALQTRGALFITDLMPLTGLLRTQVENALAELVAWGMVHSDGYAGLRHLLGPQRGQTRRQGPRSSARRRSVPQRAPSSGRWSLIPRLPASDEDARIQQIAWALLHRYGVVFRSLLERESGLPGWRELRYVYRRLEARDEIRGGRFVQRMSGEQFALPQAVERLKQLRKESSASLLAISASDPLNLAGIIGAGERVAALPGNRLLYRDGRLIATRIGREVQILETVEAEQEWQIRQALLRQDYAIRGSDSELRYRSPPPPH